MYMQGFGGDKLVYWREMEEMNRLPK